MGNQVRTNQDLEEISILKQKIQELEKSEIECKRAEAALRKCEKKLRALFDQAFHFIASITTEGMLIEANRTAMQFAGVKETDCLGKPFWDTPWWTHSVEMQNKLRESVMEAARGEVVCLEVTHPAADGNIHYVDFSLKPVKDELGKIIFLIAEGRDITESKAGEELRKRDKLIGSMVQSSAVATFVVNAEHKVIYWNKACEDLTGIRSEDLLGTSDHWKAFYDHRRPCVADIIIDNTFNEMTNLYKGYSRSVLIPDGIHAEGWYPNLGGKNRYIVFDAAPIRDDNGKLVAAIETLQDITGHKHTEEALHRSEEKFSKAFQTSPYTITITLPEDGKFIEVNDNFVLMTGFTREEALANSSIGLKLWVNEEDRQSVVTDLKAGLAIAGREFNFLMKSGKIITGLFSAQTIRLNDGLCILTSISDITEHKEVNRKLQEAVMFQQQMIDALPVPVFYKDSEGRYLGCNSSFEKFFRQRKNQITGKTVYELSPKEFADIYHEKDLALLQNPGIQIYESTVKDTDGVVHNVIFHKATFSNTDGSIGGLIGGILDITDRKLVEEALRDSEQHLHTLVQTIPDLIWLKDKDGVYLSCNTTFEHFFGAKEADIVGKTDYDFVGKELADSFREHDNKAMAAGKTTSNEEWITFEDDGHRAFLDTIKTPMYDAQGMIIGVLGIGRDITNRRAVERIRKALGAIIQAITVTVEARDPYTAGHQHRVADLARSIATEMNLPIDMIDGIRMAAAIHDLGKISVPAEILSKPTKLKKTEFDLIKEHSQSGYDILKDIDFPWPIARMVLEHHEKMNGSGYPNGLTGDNILLESRIIVVADVVESMGSHRPYRPSLGIETALNEIENNRGSIYDVAVADACLRLFREKGFQLAMAPNS